MSHPFAQSLDVTLRLVFALAAGAAIGLNRWLYHKPAGLGTHGLVALGAALAAIVATRTPGGGRTSGEQSHSGDCNGRRFYRCRSDHA